MLSPLFSLGFPENETIKVLSIRLNGKRFQQEGIMVWSAKNSALLWVGVFLAGGNFISP